MSRGVEGREIFHDDADRTTFLKMLVETKRAHALRLLAYCLMGNHFHLLLKVGDFPLYSSMHRFLTCYSHYFNQRHARQGHLFQSRYTAPVCRQDSYLENLLRYIHLNPVRAGLVHEANDWPWSGHRGLIGLANDPLLDKDDLAGLRGQTNDELKMDYLKSLEIPADIQRQLAPNDIHASQTPVGIERPPLRSLIEAEAWARGVDPDDLCGGRRGKKYTQAKLAFIEKASRCGYRLNVVAAELNCSPAAVTLLRKRKS